VTGSAPALLPTNAHRPLSVKSTGAAPKVQRNLRRHFYCLLRKAHPRRKWRADVPRIHFCRVWEWIDTLRRLRMILLFLRMT